MLSQVFLPLSNICVPLLKRSQSKSLNCYRCGLLQRQGVVRPDWPCKDEVFQFQPVFPGHIYLLFLTVQYINSDWRSPVSKGAAVHCALLIMGYTSGLLSAHMKSLLVGDFSHLCFHWKIYLIHSLSHTSGACQELIFPTQVSFLLSELLKIQASGHHYHEEKVVVNTTRYILNVLTDKGSVVLWPLGTGTFPRIYMNICLRASLLWDTTTILSAALNWYYFSHLLGKHLLEGHFYFEISITRF